VIEGAIKKKINNLEGNTCGWLVWETTPKNLHWFTCKINWTNI